MKILLIRAAKELLNLLFISENRLKRRKKLKKKLITTFGGISVLLYCFLFFSCATLSEPKILTLSFSEYTILADSDKTQKISDIEINLEVVRLSRVYDYPKLFSFELENLDSLYSDSPILKSEYKPGPLRRLWEFPFASPDGKIQLIFFFCKIKNNTKNILRMSDARIYLIVPSVDPLPAIASFEELLEQADYFESLANQKRATQRSLVILQRPPIPTGFYRSIVLQNRRNYNLINKVNSEILPGFSYEGVLVFPVIPSFSSQAKISFFDITTKVDAAGNPTEKTQFDFDLKRQFVQMWFDASEMAWKIGIPPAQNK